MINETKLELLLLINYLPYVQNFNGHKLDKEKMNKRYLELAEQFLEPYIITE